MSHTMEDNATLLKIFTSLIQRVEHNGLKGKRRDDEASAFIAGALATLVDSYGPNNPICQWLGQIFVLEINPRGWNGVEWFHSKLKENEEKFGEKTDA